MKRSGVRSYNVRSDFCSGNGFLSEVRADGTLVISATCDACNTEYEASGHNYRTWFYFAVESSSVIAGDTINIVVNNLNKQEPIIQP